MQNSTSFAIVGGIAFAPFVISTGSSLLLQSFNSQSDLHALWTYPLNTVVNLLGIAATPVCATVAFVACAFFGLLSGLTCSSDWGVRSLGSLFAVIGVVACAAVIAIRIFKPEFLATYNPNQVVLQMVGTIHPVVNPMS